MDRRPRSVAAYDLMCIFEPQSVVAFSLTSMDENVSEHEPNCTTSIGDDVAGFTSEDTVRDVELEEPNSQLEESQCITVKCQTCKSYYTLRHIKEHMSLCTRVEILQGEQKESVADLKLVSANLIYVRYIRITPYF